MTRKPIILSLVFLCIAFAGISQQADSLATPKSHYILAVGTGWSHYFNTMEVLSNKDIYKNSVGFSLLFLWDPGYRVSLGLETGIYRLYLVKKEIEPGVTGQVRTNVYPLFLVARMRIIDHFYLSVEPGLAVMTSKVSGIGDQINTTVWSYANLQAVASYMYPVSKRFSFGGEFRFLIIGKTMDYMYSLQASCAVKL